jgi:hypothetical protein
MSAKKWASRKERDRVRKRIKYGWSPERAMDLRAVRLSSAGDALSVDLLDVPFSRDATARELATAPRTQEEIADVYGVDQRTISKIETVALRKLRTQLRATYEERIAS